MFVTKIGLACDGCGLESEMSTTSHLNKVSLTTIIKDCVAAGWTMTGPRHWCKKCTEERLAGKEYESLQGLLDEIENKVKPATEKRGRGRPKGSTAVATGATVTVVAPE